MMTQLRLPPCPTGGTKEQILALRNYLFQTIQAINAALLDIEKRLCELEKEENNGNL